MELARFSSSQLFALARKDNRSAWYDCCCELLQSMPEPIQEYAVDNCFSKESLTKLVEKHIHLLGSLVVAEVLAKFPSGGSKQ